MDRMTYSRLETQVKMLNRLTGVADDAAWNTVGAYRLGRAYGGTRLERVTSESGGITVVSNAGYGTMRQCYDFVRGMIEGIETTKR